MEYYKNTCEFIVQKIYQNFGQIGANPDMKEMPSYLLWMISEMKTFTDAYKAARWIGWILSKAEDLNLLESNEISRNLIRLDVSQGLDR